MDVKSVASVEYVLIRNIIRFIAYRKNWSIVRTAEWLLARRFEQYISAYKQELDGNYYEINDVNDRNDIATQYILEQTVEIGHEAIVTEGRTEESKYFYKAFYKIEKIHKNQVLSKLELDFSEISDIAVFNMDNLGFVRAINKKLYDILDSSFLIIPTPSVTPTNPNPLEQYKIELKKLEPNNCETLKQENEQLTRELAATEGKITDLERQLAQAKSTDSLADDVKLGVRSQNLVAKVILALLDIGELDRDSLPYQYDNLNSNNRIIHDQVIKNGMNVGHQKIGYWLNLAINQTKDK